MPISSSHSRQCSPAASEHPDRDLKAVATVATWTGLTSSKCPSGHHSSSLMPPPCAEIVVFAPDRVVATRRGRSYQEGRSVRALQSGAKARRAPERPPQWRYNRKLWTGAR
jgi:hypothetical protein